MDWKSVRVALVVVAVLGAGVAWRLYQQWRPMDYDRMVAAMSASRPTTGMERYLRHWALATKAHPEIRQWFDATPTMTQVERDQVSKQKTRDGMNRLSDKDLVDRMELLSQMVEKLGVKDCAAFGRGGINPEVLGRMFNLMDDASLQRFSGIVVNAMAADLRQSPPARKALQEDVEQAFMEMGTHLTQEDAQRMADNLQDMASLPDDEACWTARLLYREGSELKGRNRRNLALALING
ncbi:hypothetical protein [Corallococcus terminator]|nr:hypothetical protein [Corallococcus terminator]